MKIKQKRTYRTVITWSEENHMRPRRAEYYISTSRGPFFASVQAAARWQGEAIKPWYRAAGYITSVKTTEHDIVEMR